MNLTKLPDIAWCEVPAGEFIMGSDRRNEKPQHIINIPYGYQAAKYPITNAQYEVFVEARGYRERRYWTAAGWQWKDNLLGPRSSPELFNLPNHPVVRVSWYEAVAYCRWLTEVLRDCEELAEGWQIRLPTEAEWEKAARGTDGRIHPWGNEFDPEKANSDATEVKSTSAVGIFPDGVSPYGCHDMAGNVWEWSATKGSRNDKKAYPYKIDNEWTADYLEGEYSRILRGGSWDSKAINLCCAYRGNGSPSSSNDYIGFRCFCVPIY